jgi:hypothetical protein
MCLSSAYLGDFCGDLFRIGQLFAGVVRLQAAHMGGEKWPDYLYLLFMHAQPFPG